MRSRRTLAHWCVPAILLFSLLSAGMPRVGTALAAPNPRLREITIDSVRLLGPTKVDILLPAGYAAGTKRYPVLYVLHGYGGSPTNWVNLTDIVKFTQALPIIVVMPDGGIGWYMDPLTFGPNWESYHINELIPYIDGHFRTIAQRSGRAIAGVSMGGMGAFIYAARHPDLFTAVASFSGVLHASGYSAFVNGTQMTASEVFSPVCGDSEWCLHAHDPVDLVSNLRGLRLFLSSGNGKPGPLDHPYIVADGKLEAAIHSTLVSMASALRGARIPAQVDDYGPGTHSWPYFQRALHRAMPLILAAFAKPSADPANWSYRTPDLSAEVWGYSIIIDRTIPEDGYTDFTGVGPRGFTISGTGTITLITAPIYRAGHAYAIHRNGAGMAALTADAHGRLHLSVPLGVTRSTARIDIGS